MLARGGITPWIEKLIGSYGQDEGTSVGQLKANVIGVGHMSLSQAQGTEGPSGLLFLSDEHVQIPAVLTASAWEDLQDREDRECFSSLLDTTVRIHNYKLLFHMSTEQTRCRFFLSVEKLAQAAVVGIKKYTPCCTTLPSVRVKICQTWRALLGQEDSQKSQAGMDLSELLGEWQHDCLLAELEHVKEKLSNLTPQPSTSTLNPSVSLPDTCTTTRWDIDRVRYKRVKSFTVPVQQLLIPESVKQIKTQQQSAQPGSESVRNAEKYETTEESTNQQLSLDITARPACASRGSPMLDDPPVVLSGSDINPISNPWDMFPPPSCTSSTKSSPEASPEASPVHDISPVFNESTTNLCPVATSTQLTPSSSKGTQTEHTSEHSLFTPYQKPPDSAPAISTSNSSSASSRGSTNTLPHPAADAHSSSTTQETSVQQASSTCRRSLRKRGAPSEPLPVVLEQSQDEQISSSPPSWLFDSQTGFTSDEGSSQSQGNTVWRGPKVPSVHSDGKPFSYIYQVKGRELLHFSRFNVGQSLLQWAVRYLLGPHCTDHNSAGATALGSGDSHVTLS